MDTFRQYFGLTKVALLSNRQFIIIISILQVVSVVGVVLGFGYFMPGISEERALYLTVGAAANAIVTIALVGLPQLLAQEKEMGRLEYFLTLPVRREAYLLAQVTFAAVMSLPAVTFALVLGAWHYGIDIAPEPLLAPSLFLSLLSLAGVGIAIGILPPRRQTANAVSQLIIFAVPLFTPVLIPAESFPTALREVSRVLPPTYAADALRASLTDLPGTHVWRSLVVMSGFSAISLGLAAWSVRRRG